MAASHGKHQTRRKARPNKQGTRFLELLGRIFFQVYVHIVLSHSPIDHQKDQVVSQAEYHNSGSPYRVRCSLASGARLRQSCGADSTVWSAPDRT
jgi:hypothetical protein